MQVLFYHYKHHIFVFKSSKIVLTVTQHLEENFFFAFVVVIIIMPQMLSNSYCNSWWMEKRARRSRAFHDLCCYIDPDPRSGRQVLLFTSSCTSRSLCNEDKENMQYTSPLKCFIRGFRSYRSAREIGVQHKSPSVCGCCHMSDIYLP